MLTDPTAPHLSFYDKQSKPRIKLALDIDGTPELLLGDKKRAYAHLYLELNGNAWLEMVGMKSRAYGGKELKRGSSIWMFAGYDPFLKLFNSGNVRGRPALVNGSMAEVFVNIFREVDGQWNHLHLLLFGSASHDIII